MAQFQPIEPYENGLLDVGDGHQIYWECYGNPTGKPALFLHGGPFRGDERHDQTDADDRQNDDADQIFHNAL